MSTVSPPFADCRLIAFDLDGTLVDSLPMIAESVNAVRAGLDLAALSLETVRRAIGAGARVLLQRTMVDAIDRGADLDDLYRRLLDEYGNRASTPVPLYPGAGEFLELI
ncbi:MAG: HAD hydrolase-like protein, partial [Planctomycetes bacterium]|nr:HAD hydrolase-like protein [Planctomycetota bacterium]